MSRRTALAEFHRRLSRLVKLVDKGEIVVVFICMIVIMFINGAEIFSRYVFDRSIFFVYEITILLANWMYFIGFCLVFNRNRDIEIVFLVNMLGRRARRVLSLATQAVVLYFAMVLSYYTFELMILQSRHTTEGLNIPNHYFSMPIFISTISIILIAAKQISGALLEEGKAA